MDTGKGTSAKTAGRSSSAPPIPADRQIGKKGEARALSPGDPQHTKGKHTTSTPMPKQLEEDKQKL